MFQSDVGGAQERGFFHSHDGTQLYYEAWLPSDTPDATVVVLHGFGEHGGRYTNLARALAPQGFEIMTFDYRGHGQAGGKRGHVDRFSDYLEDVAAAMSLARQRGHRPLFLLGHSYGGLLALHYVAGYDNSIAGLVLSSPFFGFRMVPPLRRRILAHLAGRLFPRVTSKSDIDTRALSHDEAVGTAYARDPFTHGYATARWYIETLHAQRLVLERAQTISVPVLIFAGDADAIADVATTRAVAAAMRPDSTTFLVFEGGYHELMNDTCKADVLRILGDWLKARCNSESQVTLQAEGSLGILPT